MSRTAELGQPVSLTLKLSDNANKSFVFARIFDVTEIEVTGSPFRLSYLRDGIYKQNWNPSASGEYRIEYGIYLDEAQDYVDMSYDQTIDFLNVTDSSAQIAAAVRAAITPVAIDVPKGPLVCAAGDLAELVEGVLLPDPKRGNLYEVVNSQNGNQVEVRYGMSTTTVSSENIVRIWAARVS